MYRSSKINPMINSFLFEPLDSYFTIMSTCLLKLFFNFRMIQRYLPPEQLTPTMPRAKLVNRPVLGAKPKTEPVAAPENVGGGNEDPLNIEDEFV